ncbi:hypothetical protein CPB84DRAFT_1735260 [Gymnopilus junonius]|uniref:Uncharacterized protein n=1 Tax=Gymnopilus junonius TaxID=109634 RepID=A0A9P5TIC1_GYMJU|nr:hypothetical protein CPB84DRAFT_1735260 [Gymnopilus junonius]
MSWTPLAKPGKAGHVRSEFQLVDTCVTEPSRKVSCVPYSYTVILVLSSILVVANIILSAKSGRDWTVNELRAFNIQLKTIDAATFFGQALLPVPQVSHVVLSNEKRPTGVLNKTDRLFFRHMQDARNGEESLVNDFAAFILCMFGYDDPDGVIHQRKELSFIMRGSLVEAKPNVCVMSESGYLLLVQEDKRGTHRTNAEPQLIAEAIAVFYQNNLRRDWTGQTQLVSQTIPGIIMVGVVPTFYLITVTADLLTSVISGSYPSEATIVKRCIPPVLNLNSYPEEGIVPLANRVIVMQCFQAFKAFVG